MKYNLYNLYNTKFMGEYTWWYMQVSTIVWTEDHSGEGIPMQEANTQYSSFFWK